MWILSMEVASCHHFVAYNFEVALASKFLEYFYPWCDSHTQSRIFTSFVNLWIKYYLFSVYRSMGIIITIIIIIIIIVFIIIFVVVLVINIIIIIIMLLLLLLLLLSQSLLSSSHFIFWAQMRFIRWQNYLYRNSLSLHSLLKRNLCLLLTPFSCSHMLNSDTKLLLYRNVWIKIFWSYTRDSWVVQTAVYIFGF